jgi:hypothetical protein
MAKTRITYAHLGDNVFQSDGGKMNMIGVFAGLGAPGIVAQQQFPAIYPRLALALGLATTETKLPIQITFRSEAGKDIVAPFSGTFEIDRTAVPKEESASVNLNLNFDGFQIEQPGTLKITIESNGEELGELELRVQQAEQTAPSA